MKAKFDKEYDEFEKALQELKESQIDAIKDERLDHEDAMDYVKAQHQTDLNLMDTDADEAILSILESYDKNEELTDTIPALGKDWVKIKWDSNNRTSK